MLAVDAEVSNKKNGEKDNTLQGNARMLIFFYPMKFF